VTAGGRAGRTSALAILVLALATLVLGLGSQLELVAAALVVSTPAARGTATILSVIRPPARSVPS
jgi:hypothetical protein